MCKQKLFGVVGETAGGKDTIVRLLQERLGLEPVVSNTDRPIRVSEVNGREHWFHTKEEMDKLLETEEVLAYTKTGDVRYCATTSNLSESTVLYVINPDGVRYMREQVQKMGILLDFKAIYITAPFEVRMNRASCRSDFGEAFLDRVNAETADFKLFNTRKEWDIKINNVVSVEETYIKVADFILKELKPFNQGGLL